MRRLLIAAVIALAYKLLLRPRLADFGARDSEVSAVLPGDGLIEEPSEVTTRAISISAPPSAVWPWLAQIGPSPRGGIYTYDWIENLFKLDMHSADEILPEFQNPQVGETIGFGANIMEFADIEPDHHFVMRTADGNWIWAFVLVPDGEGTRMLSRNTFRLNRLIDKVGLEPMIPGSLVMEWKMLRGFKERAERLAGERDAQGT